MGYQRVQNSKKYYQKDFKTPKITKLFGPKRPKRQYNIKEIFKSTIKIKSTKAQNLKSSEVPNIWLFEDYLPLAGAGAAVVGL